MDEEKRLVEVFGGDVFDFPPDAIEIVDADDNRF